MSRSATAIVVASALALAGCYGPENQDYGGAPYYAPDYGPPGVVGDYSGGCWNCGYGGGNRRPPPRHLGAYATAVPVALHRPVQGFPPGLRLACLSIRSGRPPSRRRLIPSISGTVSHSFLRRHLP
jgi:hypothetical protein